MEVDKFGESLFKRKRKINQAPITLPWCYFKLTDKNECLDAQQKNIRNLSTPVESFDASTKEYVDKRIEDCIVSLATLKKLTVSITEKLDKLEKVNLTTTTKNEQSRRGK